MAKKKGNLTRVDKLHQCCRRPRSHIRRRINFSILRSSPFLRADSSPKSSSSKDVVSGISLNSLDDRTEKINEIARLPLVKCNNSEDISDFYDVPMAEVESVAQNTPSDSINNRTFHEGKGDSAETLDFSPTKSEVKESSSVFINPGSLVWAKTASQVWWPAEIMGEKSTLVDSGGIHGHVLVQYYGNYHSAWVDPDRDISLFEDCFEERSCNPMEDFQNALKQALQRKRHLNACGQLIGSHDGPCNINQQDQLSDKPNSSSSSRTGDDFLERGRGKRRRKPKVHFDAMTFPLKPARKVRRFRIMRYLGLIAPIGSPFSQAHARMASK